MTPSPAASAEVAPAVVKGQEGTALPGDSAHHSNEIASMMDVDAPVAGLPVLVPVPSSRESSSSMSDGAATTVSALQASMTSSANTASQTTAEAPPSPPSPPPSTAAAADQVPVAISSFPTAATTDGHHTSSPAAANRQSPRAQADANAENSGGGSSGVDGRASGTRHPNPSDTTTTTSATSGSEVVAGAPLKASESAVVEGGNATAEAEDGATARSQYSATQASISTPISAGPAEATSDKAHEASEGNEGAVAAAPAAATSSAGTLHALGGEAVESGSTTGQTSAAAAGRGQSQGTSVADAPQLPVSASASAPVPAPAPAPATAPAAAPNTTTTKLPRVRIKLQRPAGHTAAAANASAGSTETGEGARVAGEGKDRSLATGKTREDKIGTTGGDSDGKAADASRGAAAASASAPHTDGAKYLTASPIAPARLEDSHRVHVKSEGSEGSGADEGTPAGEEDALVTPTSSATRAAATPVDAEHPRKRKRASNGEVAGPGRSSAGASPRLPDIDGEALPSSTSTTAKALAKNGAEHSGDRQSAGQHPEPQRYQPTFVSSRDFVPLPPDPSVAPAKEPQAMKRAERKSKTDALSAMNGIDSTHGAEVQQLPTPSQHPTRKPLALHGTVEPLPLYHPSVDNNVRNSAHAGIHSDSDAGVSASGSRSPLRPTIPTHHNTPRHPPPRARARLFELEEAPTFYPTLEEFADPLRYIGWVGEPSGGKGKEYGIVKIVPPEGWAPDFVLDQERFRFRTRLQKLNSLSADARASLNYQEQLQKFHAQQGHARVSIPIVDRRPVDLYQLKLAVQGLGGVDAVVRNRKWSEVTRRLGYDERDACHLSAQIKRAFTRIIHPFEEFLALNSDAKRKANGDEGSSGTAAGTDRAASIETSTNTEDDGMLVDPPSMSADIDEKMEDASASETGPGKRRSSRRRADTKGMPVTLTAQPPTTRKRKHADSPATGHDTQGSSGNFRVGPNGEGQMCEICLQGTDGASMLLCDECNRGYHMYCLDPPLTNVPKSEWYCPPCLVGTGNDYGFDDGETHSLWSFWQRAEAFRTSWWQNREREAIWQPPEGKPNGVTRRLGSTQLAVSEDDVEREFWRLVHSPDETVEVEYGADVHSTTHGSALPTLETHPLNPYSRDGWNLNNLPILAGSLLRYIKSDISGMTVPWVYVGMIFSTFCWHNEDHYTYSVNYQHFGDTKTWYGVPGADADKLDDALRKAAPDLFEQSPDLLFQLITMMSPDKLRKEGVRVYACDQRANEFVITYPKAYHSGFNHGFNINEAVNFALPDWIDMGLECVHRYQQYGRFPVFSHDELVATVYQHNQSVDTALWLQRPMQEMVERELKKRSALRELVPGIHEDVVETDLPESEYQCAHCNIFCYLSQITSTKAEGVACLDHGQQVCSADSPSRWILRLRFSDQQLETMLAKTKERAAVPDNWQTRLHKVIVSSARPPLRSLRGLLTEGEKIPFTMPEVDQLRDFVDKANRWVEEATVFIARRHQKRSGVSTRDVAGTLVGGTPSSNRRGSKRGSKILEEDDLPRASGGTMLTGDDSIMELGEQEKVYTLLNEADLLPFDAPEIAALRGVVESMEEFKERTERLFAQMAGGNPPEISECEELLSLGSSLNVKLDEVDSLQKYVGTRKWFDEVNDLEESFTNLDEVKEYMDEARRLEIRTDCDPFMMLADRYNAGMKWKARAESILGPSAKQVPQWSSKTGQYGPLPIGKRSLTACKFTQKDVEDLTKASYKTAVDPDLHVRLEQLLRQLKDLAKQCQVLSETGVLNEEDVVAHVDQVERVLQQTARINVIVDGEAALTEAMGGQGEWEGLYYGLINKIVEVVPRHPPPPHPSQATDLAAWFIERCTRVAECLDPEDEAPGSARHYCVCRATGPVADETEVVCTSCGDTYHVDCLRIPPGEIRGKKGKEWTCPFCQVEKLPKLIAPRRKTACGVQDFTEAALPNDQARFPWGVPKTKRALDSAVGRAVHFQDALYTCLSRPYHPTSRAGHALTVHLLKKCCGLFCNLETPFQQPAAALLAEVMLAHQGYDADGKPARTIPWPDIHQPDPRFAPEALPAGARDVTSEHDSKPATSLPAPALAPALPRSDYYEPMQGDYHMAHVKYEGSPRGNVGNESYSSFDYDQTSSNRGGASMSHDDDNAFRDSAMDKDDKKRKRGKRARFVFEEEVGIFVPVQGERIYCLCRRGETGRMISCDRCSLWFHDGCVHVTSPKSLGSERWICPMCCVKTERKYPYAEVRVKEMGVTDPNLWLDVRATLRSTRGPVSKLQHWTVDEDKRIALHLESYYPATAPDSEAKQDPSSETDGHGSGSPSASGANKYALGSVSKVPSWTDARARVTPVHRTPWAEEMVRRQEREAEERHRAGMTNLYNRGVTDAMIQKWFIGWNGKQLVYPRHDRRGNFHELPLGTHINLAPDDPDGSRLIQVALDHEAEQLHKTGLPVPEFVGPPGPQQRHGRVPSGIRAVPQPPPLPAPVRAPHHIDGPPPPYHGDVILQRSHEARMPLPPHPPPSRAPPPAPPLHAPPALSSASRATQRPSAGKTHQSSEISPLSAQKPTAYVIPPIPPYRGSPQSESRVASDGSAGAQRASKSSTGDVHHHAASTAVPPSAPSLPRPDSRPDILGPSSSGAPLPSFGAHLRQGSALSPPQRAAPLQQSVALSSPQAHPQHARGGSYGPYHGMHAHAANDERNRARASSTASSGPSYASPALSHGARPMLPSPSGRSHASFASPSSRRLSPPPNSARYPLGLGVGIEGMSPRLGSAGLNGYQRDSRARSPAPRSPAIPPLSAHSRHTSGAFERMAPAHHSMSGYGSPHSSSGTAVSTGRATAERALDERAYQNRDSAQAEREAEMRQLARRMRPNATDDEIEEMVHHALI